MLRHSMFPSQSKMVVAVGRMRFFMHSIRAIICFYISLMCFKLERNFKLYSFFFAFFDFDATLIDHPQPPPPPPPQSRPSSSTCSPPTPLPSQSQSQEVKPPQENCINIYTDVSSGSATVQTVGPPGQDHGIISSSFSASSLLLSQHQQLYRPFGSILEEEEELEESGPRDELWEISSSSGVNECDDDGAGDEDTLWMHHHHHQQQQQQQQRRRLHYHHHDEAMPSGDHLKKLNTIHREVVPDVHLNLDLDAIKLGSTSNPTSKAVTPPTGSKLGLLADPNCGAASLASPSICGAGFAVYKEEYDYHVEISNCNKKKVTKVGNNNPASVVRRHLTFSSSPKLTWVEGGLNSSRSNEEEDDDDEEEDCEEFEDGGGRDSDDDIVPSVGSWETLSERSSEPPATTTTCCRTSNSSASSTTTSSSSSSRNRWWKQLWPATLSVSCTSKSSAKASPTRLLSSCSERFLSCSGRVTAFDTRGVATPGVDTKYHHHHQHNQHHNHHNYYHLRSKSFVTSTTNNLGGNSSRPVSPRKSFDGGHHADHQHQQQQQQARLNTASKWFQKDFAHGHTSFTRRSGPGSGSGCSSGSSSHHSKSAVDHLSVSNWNEFPGLGALNFHGCKFSVPSSASSSWDARGISGGEEDAIRRLVKGSRGSGITVADLLMHEFDE